MMPFQMPTNLHENQPLLHTGPALADAGAVMILIHGRGASAQSILTLSQAFAVPNLAYLAPQAAQNTWYPFSFLAPLEQNQPKLDSALARLTDIVQEVEAAGLPAEKIVIGGFSQGACLALEFIARNARRYGGAIALSGGLIGPPGTPRNYPGSLAETPIFIGCSDVDAHIPLKRVQESTQVLRELGANVTERIYPNMGHTINQDELDHARTLLAGVVA